MLICEGESDCDTFNALMAELDRNDHFATCLSHPRPKTLSRHHLMLLGNKPQVCIIADADRAGKEQAENWARLLWGTQLTVKIIREQLDLAGTPDDKDLTDWVTRRGEPSKTVADELIDIMASTGPLIACPQTTAELTSMLALCHTWYRERYQPAHGSAPARWSATLDAPLGWPDVMPDHVIMRRLEDASDAPRDKFGEVKKLALPTEFGKWAKVAYGKLLCELPAEDSPEGAAMRLDWIEGFKAAIARVLASLMLDPQDGSMRHGSLIDHLWRACHGSKDWNQLGTVQLWGKRCEDGAFLVALLPVLATQIPRPVPAIGDLHLAELTSRTRDCGLAPARVDNRIRYGGHRFRVAIIDMRTSPTT